MTPAVALRKLRALAELAAEGDADDDAAAHEDTLDVILGAIQDLEELVAEYGDPDGEVADEPEDPAE